ncbi:MAG: hypothetical protein K2X57_28775 [Xanthobacteraceae bacterium]|nr:hypothetical protein [Xanthobacteraceae bacterium]
MQDLSRPEAMTIDMLGKPEAIQFSNSCFKLICFNFDFKMKRNASQPLDSGTRSNTRLVTQF